MGKYEHLLQPFTIGKTTFKNRMLAGPLGFTVPNDGGWLRQENIDYYEKIAMGGTARVITGDHSVNPTNAGYWGGRDRLFFFNDDPMFLHRLEDSLEAYVTAVHRHDAIAFTEFDHEGISASVPPDAVPIGPITFVRPDGVTVQGMDERMMDDIANDFAKCCRRARDFGLDGVMVHGGHGKLFDVFRSSRFNTRTDAYGGSLKNRCRFPIMVLERIREAVGPDFLIELRLSVDECYDEGISLEESIDFLKMIDGRGLVDMLHINSGIHFVPRLNMRVTAPAYYPTAFNRQRAKRIKEAGIRTPVVLINAINDPDDCEDIIASGDADFVCMARQIDIADPYFPRKVEANRPEQINTCIRCYSCYDGGRPCAVNPVKTSEFAKGLYYELPRAPSSRRLLIVGGGIAGLKAAETAAARGHSVVLAEKREILGGLLRFADSDVYKHDIRSLKNNLIKRLEQQPNVELRLGTEVTFDYVAQESPDALIVALGAVAKTLVIPGAENSKVIAVMDVYDHPELVGDSIVIIGGGLTACELAMHLGKIGKQVTIIGRRGRLAFGEKPLIPFFAAIPGYLEEYSRFDYPVESYVGYDCMELTHAGIRAVKINERILPEKQMPFIPTWFDTEFDREEYRVHNDRPEILIRADTYVVAAGELPNLKAVYAFNGSAPYVRAVGDCVRPGKIRNAIAAAYHAVMDI